MPEPSPERRPGPSLRVKLALSYAAVVVVVGALLLGVVWLFLLRYVPERSFVGPDGIVPTRSDLLDAFAPRAAIAMVFLLAAGLLGGWLLAGRMLAPLARITEATRLAASGSLAHRIALPGRGDELRELADSFDAMLARLETHVAEQQRFAANASHELRTPLAVTQALLDVARTDPSQRTDEFIERLHAVNARAIRLTEALLLLSRADRRAFTREAVDLSLVAEEATETLMPLAEKHGVSIHAAGDITPTSGSHALLLQMAMNLVHNGIVHNLPDAGFVELATAAEGQSVVLTVENSGEELDPKLVATFAEPFQRGTERVRSDQAGVGLGLAIVDSIVRAHDGSLSVVARAGGGLSITVRLPAAASERAGVSPVAAQAPGYHSRSARL